MLASTSPGSWSYGLLAALFEIVVVCQLIQRDLAGSWTLNHLQLLIG